MSLKTHLRQTVRQMKFNLARRKRLKAYKKADSCTLDLDPDVALGWILNETDDRPLFAREQKIQPLSENGPDVSVVIPFYNSNERLIRCLKSVLNQKTGYDMEVIAVNDGSTDNTLELLNEIQDDRLKVISQDNHGAAYARNTGVMEATGDYVWCIDSDDYVDDQFVERMIKEAKTQNADIVKSGYRIFLNDGRTVEKILPGLRVEGDFDPYVNDQDGFIWNMVVRRELYDGIGMPEGWWFEDMTNRLWLLRRAKKFIYLPEAHYNYTINEGSLSSVQSNSHSPRALEQVLLLHHVKGYSRTLNLPQNEYEYVLMIKEMGITLYNRIRYMDEPLRQAAFILACQISDEYRSKGLNSNLPNAYYQALDQVLANRQFEKWKALCA